MTKQILLGDYHKDFIKEKHEKDNGEQILFKYDNGYGASVLFTDYSYELELGVIEWNGDKYNLRYDTRITDEVIGHMNYPQLMETLEAIKNLYKDWDPVI